ncbi:MAG: WXG100 family type VII secretion target [Lachnospiraceae bacterium]|nr:WXG100 family type VII secretion target [Lachnospiraceae bacterium]
MAITYLEVNTGTLSSDANDMEEEINQATVSLTELTEEMDELNAMWQGAANMAFRAAVRKDVNSMTEMLALMSALVESCKNAAREYNRCETEVLAEVASIRI